jgi:hypothetical protein
MKSIRTTSLFLATLTGLFLLSGCSTWHTTGETQIGDTTVVNKSSSMKSEPIRGMSAPAAPPKGNAAHGSGSVSR